MLSVFILHKILEVFRILPSSQRNINNIIVILILNVEKLLCLSGACKSVQLVFDNKYCTDKILGFISEVYLAYAFVTIATSQSSSN